MRFYRDLVGMLDQTFAESYGSNGAIFGLPSSSLTLEIVETDHHEQLCRYCSDKRGQQAALTGLQEVATQPVEQRPFEKLPEPSSIATRMAARLCLRLSCTGLPNREPAPHGENTSSAGLKCSTAPLHDGDDAQAKRPTPQPTTSNHRAHPAGGTEVQPVFG